MPKLVFSVFPGIFVFFVIFVAEIAVGLVAPVPRPSSARESRSEAEGQRSGGKLTEGASMLL